jgi:hypothetical protein
VTAQPGKDQHRLLPGETGADAATLPASERDPGVAVPFSCLRQRGIPFFMALGTSDAQPETRDHRR